MTVELNTPFLEGGINNAHFFNGRVLTAEALQDEQTAGRMHRQHLARAVGEGVLNGLIVTPNPAGTGNIAKTVSISKGMALNRKGQTVSLPHDITLTLVPAPEPMEVNAADVFVPCETFEPTLIASGKGVYILTAVPASGFKDKTALMHGLADNGKATGCGYKYEQEGVRFRLVKMDVDETLFNSPEAGGDAQPLSMFRNLMAHLCFGTPDKIRFLQDPFNVSPIDTYSFDRYGAVDALRPEEPPGEDEDIAARCSTEITDCDVPLALIFWAEKGIEFVDMWSVRRRVHFTAALKTPAFPSKNRQAAEAEAAFFQFQDHLETLFRTTDGVGAKDYFRYLPPVGMIPLDNTETDKTKRDIEIKFFEDLTVRDPVFIEGVNMRYLIGTSFSYPPIDLEEKELIWLYRVRENMRFFEDHGKKQGQAYLVFSTGYIPFQGEARYNLSRWNYSNYGPFVVG